MTLPFPPRRSHLRAFWLALNVPAAVVSAVLAAGFRIPYGVPAILCFFVTLSIAGLLWQDAPVSLYRIWNKAAREVARLARWWVLTVTYYVVFSAVGRSRSRLELTPRPGSMWKPLRFVSNGLVGAGDGSERTWLERLLDDARAPERIWWLGVAPFLVILSLFPHENTEQELPANVYTLF